MTARALRSLSLATLAACSSSTPVPVDARRADATSDAPVDTPAVDATVDATLDATVDAAVDAPTDAMVDAPTDAMVDAPAGPHVVAKSRADGLATATTSVRFIGSGFTPDTTATFNGTPGVGCNAPSDSVLFCSAPPAAIGHGVIVVSNLHGTFTDLTGWTYTGVRNETDTAGEADYCNLQFPSAMSVPVAGGSTFVYGRIYEAGLTEAAGAPPGVRANVGWGPAGTSPLTDGRWTWFAAGWNLQVGNDDEFYGAFIGPPTAGPWAFAFRFSLDNGVTHTYCDLDGAGSNPGLSFSAASLGALTVTP